MEVREESGWRRDGASKKPSTKPPRRIGRCFERSVRPPSTPLGILQVVVTMDTELVAVVMQGREVGEEVDRRR